jgi:TorA maturation chaperone TorD
MQETLANISQRADSYKFLSECYYPLDDELVQKVIDTAQDRAFFFELACCVPPAVELKSLSVDFAELFVGPYKLLAPPYGSVYFEDNRIMGNSTIDVRNCYESEGLDIVIKDAPDHIAVELEFMYYLIARQIEAVRESNLHVVQACRRKQFDFLQAHLGRWLPEFVEKVQKNARTEFYRRLAGLTEAFVQNDMKTLAEHAACDN